jgi:hypothetical protein
MLILGCLGLIIYVMIFIYFVRSGDINDIMYVKSFFHGSTDSFIYEGYKCEYYTYITMMIIAVCGFVIVAMSVLGSYNINYLRGTCSTYQRCDDDFPFASCVMFSSDDGKTYTSKKLQKDLYRVDYLPAECRVHGGTAILYDPMKWIENGAIAQFCCYYGSVMFVPLFVV